MTINLLKEQIEKLGKQNDTFQKNLRKDYQFEIYRLQKENLKYTDILKECTKLESKRNELEKQLEDMTAKYKIEVVNHKNTNDCLNIERRDIKLLKYELMTLQKENAELKDIMKKHNEMVHYD